MHTPKAITVAVLTSVIFLSCTKSPQQEQFEDQAFSTPDGITEMTTDGNKVSGRTDPDDWRIGPMFQGFIEVATPAFPNPVNINSSFRIDMDVKGFESISGLVVFAFKLPNELVGPIFETTQNPLSPGLHTITLSASQLSNSSNTGEIAGLHRILIFDRRDNLITYGDVKVE